jgi:putative acetyltransferase
MIIREIQKKDNQAVGDLVQMVLMEMGAPKIGTAYSDPFLFNLYEVYSQPKTMYFVIENEGKIVGGAGIGTIESADESICELQKMYFLPETRGLGLGLKLMEKCLQKAREFGYKHCYIETMPYMEAAQKLYKKVGFVNIDAPIGNTGHTSCPVWLLLDLRLQS